MTTTYFDGDPKPISAGPGGREPEILATSDANLLPSLGGVIQRLVVGEGMDPSGIVVLTPRGKSTSLLLHGHKLANRTLSWDDAPAEGSIRVASIYGFKGLESDVVILVESNNLQNRTKWKELCYVALTRARHHLIVLGDLPAVARGAD